MHRESDESAGIQADSSALIPFPIARRFPDGSEEPVPHGPSILQRLRGAYIIWTDHSRVAPRSLFHMDRPFSGGSQEPFAHAPTIHRRLPGAFCTCSDHSPEAPGRRPVAVARSKFQVSHDQSEVDDCCMRFRLVDPDRAVRKSHQSSAAVDDGIPDAEVIPVNLSIPDAVVKFWDWSSCCAG
jgi:hypothetical protein